jgi:hypothetical protein
MVAPPMSKVNETYRHAANWVPSLDVDALMGLAIFLFGGGPQNE